MNGFESGRSIIATSSTGNIHGKPTKLFFNASKASIDGSSRCMAVRVKDRQNEKNTVMSSYVRTQMFNSSMTDYPDSSDVSEILEMQHFGVSPPCE